MGTDLWASVIILTKNAGDNLGRLLDRISSQKCERGFEVLVIDSGSTDSTLAVAQRFPARVFRIKPEEFHHGRTRNMGAELAQGEVLVYITQDALPLDNSWLQKITDSLREEKVAMVVGRQIAWESTKPPEKFFYINYFPEYRINISQRAPEFIGDNMFISNVNSALRREVWDEFRFSEKVLMAEDKELAKRLLQAGWTILYEPAAAVYHAHDFNLRSLWQRSVDAGIALSQGVNVPRSRNWAGKRAWYFVREVRYVAGQRQWWKWLPYSAAYEGCRLFGAAAGWLKGRL
jgi:rhamnosyltransferase